MRKNVTDFDSHMWLVYVDGEKVDAVEADEDEGWASIYKPIQVNGITKDFVIEIVKGIVRLIPIDPLSRDYCIYMDDVEIHPISVDPHRNMATVYEGPVGNRQVVTRFGDIRFNYRKSEAYLKFVTEETYGQMPKNAIQLREGTLRLDLVNGQTEFVSKIKQPCEHPSFSNLNLLDFCEGDPVCSDCGVIYGSIKDTKSEPKEPRIIRVYASLDRSDMSSAGEESGLDEKASNYLAYFTEVPLDLTVRDDGTVTKCVAVCDFDGVDK